MQFKSPKLLLISFSILLSTLNYSYAQVAEDTFTGETLDDYYAEEAAAPDEPTELIELPEEELPPPPPKKTGLQAITTEQQLERLGEKPQKSKNKFEAPSMPKQPLPKPMAIETIPYPQIAPMPPQLTPPPYSIKPPPPGKVVIKKFDAPPMPKDGVVPAPIDAPKPKNFTPPLFSRGSEAHPLLYNKKALNFLPLIEPLLRPSILPIEISPERGTKITPEGEVKLEPKEPFPSRITHSFYFLASSYKPEKLLLSDNQFEGHYGGTPIMIELTFEPYLLTGFFGIIGWRGNLDFWYIDGRNYAGTTLQDMDLYIVGITSSLAYHGDFFENQLVVPWTEFGFGQNIYVQTADAVAGGAGNFTKVRNIWYASVGAKVLIDWFDPRGTKRLDSRVGINHTYLFGMFRQYFSQSGQYDFSGPTYLAGINVEF